MTKLFVTPRRQMHVLELQWLLVQQRRLLGALIFPRGGIAEPVVVAPSLSIFRLVLYPEVPAARLLAVQRIRAHHLGELQKIGNPASLLESLVQFLSAAGHTHVLPELATQRRNGLQRGL